MKVPPLLLGGIALAATSLVAQGTMAPRPVPPMERPMSATADPIVASARVAYDTMKRYIVAAADEMPEKDYGSKPATRPAADKQEIRTFGQIIGHIAQENFMFCASAQAQTAPPETETIEKTRTSKADLQKALADSFNYCDRAWAGTTDSNAAAPGKYPDGIPLPAPTRIGALVFNASHDAEHYGNLVTYLRAMGLVPPSSQAAAR
jgi:uncharacterized damage-inducible protein DinB